MVNIASPADGVFVHQTFTNVSVCIKKYNYLFDISRNNNTWSVVAVKSNPPHPTHAVEDLIKPLEADGWVLR